MGYNEVAADWWTSRIRIPTSACFNNGETGCSGSIASLLALINAESAQYSEEDLANFENELADIISEVVTNHGSVILSCDYGPLGLLDELATKHNIPHRRFPWKTYMEINMREVKVQFGYNQPFTVIFPCK